MKNWFWKRRQMESDMDEELRFHIDSYASDLISRGTSKEAAYRHARIEFGAVEARKEECRESLGLRLWDELRSDLRGGSRILRQSPLFTAVAVVSLALGIGANTAIFTLANEYLLKGMGVPQADRLRLLGWVEGPQGNVGHVWGGFERTSSGESMSTTFPYPVYQEMRRHNNALRDIAGFKDLYQLTAMVDGSAEPVNAIMVSGNFYHTLDVRLEVGRGINPEDDTAGAGGAVVISDTYWTSRFGRSADVLGKTITLNSEPMTIVGVNAPEFKGVRVDTSPQVFFPMALQQAVIPDPGGSLLNNDKIWWLYMIGPMKQGVSDKAAAASLAQAFRNACHITMPYRKEIDIPRFALRPGARGSQWSDNRLTKPLYLLLSISGLVLLIACANLANLLLARGAVRQREISLRLAMGAGRARIMRQIMTESMMLAFLGGAAGLLLGYLGRNVIPGLVANSWDADTIDLRMDGRVFAFAFAVTTLTGLLFGTVPAWRSTQRDANAALKETGRMSTSRPKVALGKALVVVQIALSLLLIVGAGLFLQTLFHLHHVPTGMQTDHVILFGLNPPKSRFTPGQRVTLFQRVARGLSQIPGVEKSTSSEEPMLASGVDTDCYRTAEMPGMDFTTNPVGADFFETFGIPILNGRSLSLRDDQDARRVAVINQTLAEKIYPGRDSVGHSIASCDTNAKPMEIVGVSADSKFTDLRQSAPPTIYIRLHRLKTAFRR